MVLSDFLTETRRRWLKAFQLFKGSKSRKIRNRVSPAIVRSPSYSGTVDASSEIDLQRFCACRTSLPPLPVPENERTSCYSSFGSYASSYRSVRSSSNDCNDSAYDSARSSPSRGPVSYATVTYFNVNDSEDSSSIKTEYTILEYEDEAEDERVQNLINESLEFSVRCEVGVLC